MISPLQSPISLAEISSIEWRYSLQGDPGTFADLQLLADGTIGGASNANESRWYANDHSIFILDEAGTITVELVRESSNSNIFAGRYSKGREIGLRLEPVKDAEKLQWRLRPGTREAFAEDIIQYGWSIGAHTYGLPHIEERGRANLSIGRFTSIGPGVMIILGNHRTTSASTYPFSTLRDFWPSAPSNFDDHLAKGDVRIGNDVWIGARAIILSGVDIGDGAVVAAGSVVSKSVGSYKIVGGTPAKEIKDRFSESIAEKLSKLSWWNWNEEKIDRFLPLIMSEDVSSFIRQAEEEQEASL
ncbi:succinyltransferase-like protein [Rhizobium sp. PP-WC-1G-195]|nr:succinyltransferase-like protein [Rhizobium sp. PP-WC-1G-195]TCP76362.1 succinyltransferase-like protein [Rhizobium sp. PP-CC-2G-626]